MNPHVSNSGSPDPELADLIAEDHAAWTVAWKILYGIAQKCVPGVIQGVDEPTVNEIYTRSLEDVRKGLLTTRSSPDIEKGISWKQIQDFAGVRRMFVRIVRGKAIDYLRKHGRESPYKDELSQQSSEESIVADFEWQMAFETVLNKLRPTIYQDLLVGMFIKGLDTHELMALHNLTKVKVGVYTMRAKEQMRNFILKDSELCGILWPKESK